MSSICFAQLTLVEKLPDRWRGYAVGLWECTCGNRKKLPIARVASGVFKSCGCRRIKHGQGSARGEKAITVEYRAWMAMRSRCAATEGSDYERYAARGITVCPEWDNFETFLTDMGPKPSAKHSLGRKDNDLGYSKENCRWETPREQMTNLRTSVIWHIRGLCFDTYRDAGRTFGVDPKTIRYWVKTAKENCYVVPKY